MTSFHKSNIVSSSIKGTKYKNNSYLLSSGIPSLDFIIGGGVPSSTIFAIEEDLLGVYSKIILKYFLAEGVLSYHSLFIASADENPEDIVKELPQATTTSEENEMSNVTSDVEKMKIAWRYEGLGQVESSFGTKTGFGHNFDLSRNIDENTLKNCDIIHWTPKTISEAKKEQPQYFNNVEFYNLLSALQNIVTNKDFAQGSSKFLRVAIHSLGSPVWMATKSDENIHSEDLVKFIYCLKTLIQNKNVVVFVSIPSLFIDEKHTIKRLLYSVSNAVRIESFEDIHRKTNPVYKDYHGLFHITKLSMPNSIVNHVPPCKDMAFKLKRKKFVIEKLHLPPELQETKEREQDDITAIPKTTCGGFGKRSLDF